jgi:hypothetical protein
MPEQARPTRARPGSAAPLPPVPHRSAFYVLSQGPDGRWHQVDHGDDPTVMAEQARIREEFTEGLPGDRFRLFVAVAREDLPEHGIALVVPKRRLAAVKDQPQ